METPRSPRERGGIGHPWWMIGLCVLPLAALVAIAVFNVPISSVLLFGLVLLCPLMHLFMMGSHGHGTADHAGHHQPERPANPPSGS